MSSPVAPNRSTLEVNTSKRAKRRRRLRRFITFWTFLTFLAGVAACAGIYVVTGTLDTAEGNGEVAVEVQTSPSPTGGTPAATLPPTTVAQAQTPVPPTATTPAQPPTPAIVPTINRPEIDGKITQLQIGAHVGYGYLDETGKLDLMRGAGMTWVKQQLRYEPGMNPDDYGWQVQYLHERGFKILWGLVGEKDKVLTAGYADQYAQFAARLAEIGSDAIEVWNEPNLDREWPTGSVSGASYTELLKVVYPAIKAKNPNTMVISGATAPTGFFGGCQAGGCDDNVFYQQMAQAGAGDYLDCIGAHYNEGIVSPTATTGDPRDPYPTRYLMPNTDRAYSPFGGQKPVCYTELGYLSPEGFSSGLPAGFEWAGNVTVADQSSWLATAALMLDQTGYVKLMIIWNLDYKDFNPDPHGGFAMIRPDGTCPACDSLWTIRAQ